MDRTEKQVVTDDLRDKFSRMTSAVFVDFKGMTVETVTKLRDEFRKSGVEYRVVKNSLVKQALRDKPWAGSLKGTLTGMTGVAWSYEDPSAAAKVVKAFRKDNQKLVIKAGLIEGQLLDANGVETQLATMPGKNELRAMLLATMQAPLQQFLQQLNAPAQNFVYLLKANEDAAGGSKESAA
jgi:large subunit ribosomal protein L10